MLSVRRDLLQHLRYRQVAVGAGLAIVWFALWCLAAVNGVNDYASLWYPPAGLTFAVALVLPARHWPVLVTMALLGSAMGRDVAAAASDLKLHLVLVVLQGLAHGLPYLAGGLLVRRLGADPDGPAMFRMIPLLVVATAAAATAALAGVAVLTAAGMVTKEAFLATAVPWFTGDLIGVATVTPFAATLLVRTLPGWLDAVPHRRAADVTADVSPGCLSLPWLALLVGVAVVVPTAVAHWAVLPGGETAAALVPLVVMLMVAATAPAAHAYGALFFLSSGLGGVAAIPGTALPWAEPTVVLSALAVVTLLGVELRRVRDESARDGLTGTLTRRHWFHRAERAARCEPACSVILLDLDHFKGINDAFGHAVGDAVLRRSAARLREHAPEGALLGRLGGEEFAVLVPSPIDGALTLAAGLKAELAALRHPRLPRDLAVTASFGVAELAAGEALATALAEADAALYRAKAAGRDRVCGPERVPGPAPSPHRPCTRRRSLVRSA